MLVLCRKNKKRVLAVLLAVILPVILFFAVSLITENLEHDCTEEHCPVCECMQLCQSLLRQTGAGLLPVICLVFAFFAAYEVILCFSAEFLPHNLITLKIRLNI